MFCFHSFCFLPFISLFFGIAFLVFAFFFREIQIFVFLIYRLRPQNCFQVLELFEMGEQRWKSLHRRDFGIAHRRHDTHPDRKHWANVCVAWLPSGFGSFLMFAPLTMSWLIQVSAILPAVQASPWWEYYFTHLIHSCEWSCTTHIQKLTHENSQLCSDCIKKN